MKTQAFPRLVLNGYVEVGVLKSMDVTHSRVWREVLVVFGDSILNFSVFSPQPLLLYVLYHNFANLISKLNFYKLIPYPMDNMLNRSAQILKLYSPGGASYFLPV